MTATYIHVNISELIAVWRKTAQELRSEPSELSDPMEASLDALARGVHADAVDLCANQLREFMVALIGHDAPPADDNGDE